MLALVTLDFINDIIHPRGKLAGKGYADFASDHGTLRQVNRAILSARQQGCFIVQVRLGFPAGYPDHPISSPLFGKARDFKALELGTWGTQFCDELDIREEDTQVIKTRVSPFFKTNLEASLRERGIDKILVAGVATDLAVEAAVREAHDRDYRVTVLSDCCAAATEEDHDKSLSTLKKLACVARLDDIDPN